MFTSCSKNLARRLRLQPMTRDKSDRLHHQRQRVCHSRHYSATVLRSHYGEVESKDLTLSQFVWSRSDNWKHLPALTCGKSGRSYTYGMMKGLSYRGAQAILSSTQLQPGDRVGLILPNIPEFCLAVHSGLLAGLVVTFANPLYGVAEIAKQFQNAKVRCIVTVPPLLEAAQAVAKTLGDYECTINVGGDSRPGQKIYSLEALLSSASSAELPELRTTDVATLPYSSGTTGPPKGVMLTHRNLVTNISQLLNHEIIDYADPSDHFQERVFTVMPFFHIYGFNSILNYLMHIGAHLVTIPKFTSEDYVELLAKYEPTVLFVVPSLLLFMITHPQVTRDHLKSVKKIYCGASPMKKNMIDQFFEKIGRRDCVVSQGYGMTETSPGVTLTPYAMPYAKSGSCGRLLPSTLARVVDLKDNKDVGMPNRPGELLVKGPQVMKGYLDNPRATSEIIDIDGWLHTGDVVYYDEDEYFYVVDRTKELIKVKGNQVSPTELESLLLEMPGIADVAVIGVHDDFAGELPRACVVQHAEANLTAEQVQNFLAPKVASFKKLAGGVQFVKAIPRNPSGKILRNELKNLGS